MKLDILPIDKALNKAFLRQTIKSEEFERFRANLADLLARLRSEESEEHLKNHLADFLKDTWYKPTNLVNTSDRIDLAIYDGTSSTDPVAVMFETKSPVNKQEMMSREKPNAKAFHELVLYYLRQSLEEENQEINYLIVTNFYEWFIFDGVWFERNIRRNAKLVKAFKGLKSSGHDNRHFYDEILRSLLDGFQDAVPCCWFDLRDYEQYVKTQHGADAGKLEELYKLLSPQHLLKQPFRNDSNTLNREFYNEMLHLLGLEESKVQGKKVIRRKAPGQRDEGSLLENTLNLLTVNRTLETLDGIAEHGDTDDDRLFSVALELCITWLNRILFLKLLEGRIIAWNRGERRLAFLNSDRIRDFDDLQELFFEVLARRNPERTPSVATKFGDIPYLNSSLFEISDLERKALQISNLKGRLEMPLHRATVLKDSVGKRRSGALNTLRYLLEFLDAFDFAGEGTSVVQESPKTIINASVLGLIFEKINGYRDGSFYTPGFITMHLSRETLRRAVVEKFRAARLLGPHNPTDFDDLCDRLDYSNRDKRRQANAIINSLRICDPSVGSGHFLVSALNELLVIKGELGVIEDQEGKRLKGVQLSVVNDELEITAEDEPFVYNPRNPEARRIQKTLFHEKQTIIENCLFGVDINPKSVAICRLRLWIELLKHAYYHHDVPPPQPSSDGKGNSGGSELETLPNIDINIKCGNSLVSRFSLDNDQETLSRYAPAERQKLRSLTTRYREKVREYKQGSKGPSNKLIIRRDIERIKEEWRTFSEPADYYLRELRHIKNELAQEIFVFDNTGLTRREELHRKAEELERKIEERQRTVYANAFEWRYEFPEVLDDDGYFIGFDVVLGNPPYMRADSGAAHLAMRRHIIASERYETLWEKWDLYIPFLELGYHLSRPGGAEAMIVSDAYCHAKYAQKSQEWFLKNSAITEIDFLSSLDVFDEASVHNVICFFEKRDGKENRPVRRLHEGEFGKVRILPTDEQRNLTYRLFFPEGDDIAVYSALTVPLAEICYISVGMVVHADERGHQGAFELSDLVTETQDDLHNKPFVEGKHLARWQPDSHRWLEWGSERAPAHFRRPTFSKLYDVSEKLLVFRMAGKDVKAVYDDNRLLCNHTVIVCVPWHELADVRNKSLQKTARYSDEKPRPELPLREHLNAVSRRFSVKYLAAVMNSSVACGFLQSIRRSNTDIYPDDWKKLPIPDVSVEEQNSIVAVVDEILTAKMADPKADIGLLEQRVDEAVRGLYG